MGRTPCCSKNGLNKGAWTAQEDQVLKDYMKTHGEGKWRSLPKLAGLNRCGKSCRLRWLNYLRPDIKRGNISEDEEDLIIRLHKLLGNRWSLIAGRLPGRTDNEVKNYWNTTLRKKIKGQSNDQKNQTINRRSRAIIKTASHCTAKLASVAREGVPDRTGEENAIGGGGFDCFDVGEFLSSDSDRRDLWKLCDVDDRGGFDCGGRLDGSDGCRLPPQPWSGQHGLSSEEMVMEYWTECWD